MTAIARALRVRAGLLAGLAMPARARFRLPPVVRKFDWRISFLLAWFPYIAVYQLTNRFPVREPTELTFTWLDSSLPFLPGLLPLYVAYIPFYWWTLTRSENDREANRIFYATHFQLLLATVVFLSFPVRMPRELFYAGPAYNWADTFWRWFDAPNNCFPSLHVASSLLLIQLNWRRPHRLVYTAIAIGIIASTVLVKQHYVVDALGAFIVYLASVWFLARLEIDGVDREGWLVRRRRA